MKAALSQWNIRVPPAQHAYFISRYFDAQ